MTASQVRLAKDRRSLTVHWSDGQTSILSAWTLRRNGRSADEVRARIDGHDTLPGPEIAIESVSPVGAYALNITFTDGYERGIYPWAYLARLADIPQSQHPALAYIAS